MRLAVILAIAVLLSACGGSPPTSAPASPPASPAPAPATAAPAPQTAPKPTLEANPTAASKPSLPAAAPSAQPAASTSSRLRMGVGGPTSTTYVYTAALSKLLQAKVPGLNVTLTEGGGAVEHFRRMSQGQNDFAIMGTTVLYLMYSGQDPAWQERPLQDARTLWVFDASAHEWFVREDAGIKDVEQLQGKDFSPGGKGTSTENIARRALTALGIEPKWYSGGMEDALAAFKDRRIVGMGKQTAVKRPDALIVDASVATKLRVLNWTPEQVQKIRAKQPFLSPTEVPAGTYKADWNAQPITTWADGLGMGTLARLPEDLAYAFTKAAIEDSKPGGELVQAEAYPAMKEFDVTELTMSLATVPLHAGTYRYFREIGVAVPDRLKPPEVK
ncbi:MAG: TAXI family TRAP transporter solute-binding subunit [Chloroflexi bacterium]|nr:TAXI family TRAP transporter solute-binding subunit [Chloroflexota bacterium]